MGSSCPRKGGSPPRAKLTAVQKQRLLALIAVWVNILNEENATLRLTEITAIIDRTRFAWYDSTDLGAAAYYCIHGPKLFAEYAPQRLGD